MNLKSIQRNPAQLADKGDLKSVSAVKSAVKVLDAASDKLKQDALEYIGEWVKAPANRNRFFKGQSDTVLEEVILWFFEQLIKPREDSEKNRKSGKVGRSRLDDFDPSATGVGNEEQALRRTIRQFCNMRIGDLMKSNIIVNENTSSVDEMGGCNSEGEEFTAEEKLENLMNKNGYAYDDEEEPELDEVLQSALDRFNQLPYERQQDILNMYKSGKNLPPEYQGLLAKMKQSAKAFEGGDDPVSQAATEAGAIKCTDFMKDGFPCKRVEFQTPEQARRFRCPEGFFSHQVGKKLFVYDKSEIGVYDSYRIKDEAENDGPKPGLSPDQWPAEVEDPNTGEMKKVDESMVEGVSDSRIRDSKMSFTLRDLLEGMDLMENGQVNVDKLNSVLDGEIEVKNNSTLLHKFANLFDFKKSNSIKTATKDSKQLKKRDFVTVVGAKRVKSKVKDSRTTPYNMVIAQLRNIPVGKTGNLNFETGNYDFQFDVTARDGKSYDICMSSPEVGNCQSVAEGNAFQMIKSLADAYIKKNSPASYSDIKDSARQFKVYYLDENRKTRTLFVEAYDEDDALEVAAEKIPARCEVHSAVDTNPLG